MNHERDLSYHALLSSKLPPTFPSSFSYYSTFLSSLLFFPLSGLVDTASCQCKLREGQIRRHKKAWASSNGLRSVEKCNKI
jgi:hypothetical protein